MQPELAVLVCRLSQFEAGCVLPSGTLNVRWPPSVVAAFRRVVRRISHSQGDPAGDLPSGHIVLQAQSEGVDGRMPVHIGIERSISESQRPSPGCIENLRCPSALLRSRSGPSGPLFLREYGEALVCSSKQNATLALFRQHNCLSLGLF
jgi:hypothetical protein